MLAFKIKAYLSWLYKMLVRSFGQKGKYKKAANSSEICLFLNDLLYDQECDYCWKYLFKSKMANDK